MQNNVKATLQFNQFVKDHAIQFANRACKEAKEYNDKERSILRKREAEKQSILYPEAIQVGLPEVE